MINKKATMHQSSAPELPRTVMYPRQIAQAMARSFVQEMTQAGFSCELMIYATAEVVAELSGLLRIRSEPDEDCNMQNQPTSAERLTRGTVSEWPHRDDVTRTVGCWLSETKSCSINISHRKRD
jgi:hypothetical protein